MTDKPQRIQRKRTKGWKMPPGTVYVGRPGRFGNPFHVGQDGTHEECVELHRRWLSGSLADSKIRDCHPRLGAILRELPGKNLACWCPLDQACHADVLLELANGGDVPRKSTT